MKNINQILVASELNINSYEALAYGITLGLMYDAKVSCIHLVKPSQIDLLKESFLLGKAKYGEVLKKAKTESEGLLNHLIEVIGMELGIRELEVDLKIVSGNLSKSIMNYADEIDADLVVISTLVGSKFSRTTHTNLALNMIKLEKANVLLVPSDFRLERIERIGAFINFEGEDIGFIQHLLNMSKRTELGIKLIHVVGNPKDLEKAKELKRSFEKTMIEEIKEKKISFHLEMGPIRQVVSKLDSTYKIDLMTIRAYKRHWNNLKPSSAFTDTIIEGIKTPLLVWKSNQNEKIVIK